MPTTRPTTTRPLHVLHVLGYAGGGGRRFGITGVERVVQLLAAGLAPERIATFAAYPATGALSDALQASCRAVLPQEPHRRFDAAYTRALAGFVRQHAIDVVVSHGYRFDFHAALASRRTHTPHLVVRAVALADEPMPRRRKLLFGAFDAWTLGRCAGIVAVSQASMRRMVRTQRLSAARFTVIPNGVRLPAVEPAARDAARRALGVQPDERLVGGVGQLIARKSFDDLVRAAAALRERHPRLVVAVLGEGPERPHLETLARELGVRLLLPGYLADPYPMLAGFDVAVLPSRAEGMPLVVLESMALGVATVATDVAGTPEIVEDGVSGLLVRPGDVRGLAAAFDRLLADDTLRARIAAAGARRVTESFSLDAMLAGFDAVLHRAAGRDA